MEGALFFGPLRERKILNWRNVYEGFERDVKMLCKRVSLFIGAVLGNL
jgi:hypothetical protein